MKTKQAVQNQIKSEIAEYFNPPVEYQEKKTWNRYGLELLVQEAKEYFETRTGVDLPYNLVRHAPYASYSRNVHCQEYAHIEIVDRVARFCGWLKSAAEIPNLVYFIEKTTSRKGMNSPRTKLRLWRVTNHFPSPHRFNRHLKATRRRANQILKPYGISVSNWALAHVLSCGLKRTNKAAIMAAAYTFRIFLDSAIHHPEGKEYTNLEILMGFRGFKNIGSFEAFLAMPRHLAVWAFDKTAKNQYKDITTAIQAAERKLVEYYIKEDDYVAQEWADVDDVYFIHNIKTQRLISPGGFWSFIVTHKNLTHYTYRADPRGAIKEALRQWAKQKKKEIKRESLIDLFKNNPQTITFEDAKKAGLCEYGVQQFIHKYSLFDEVNVFDKTASSDFLIKLLNEENSVNQQYIEDTLKQAKIRIYGER